MHRRFFIFFLSLLLAHIPLAFAPGDSDSEHESVPPRASRKPSAQATELAPESQRPAKRRRLNAAQAEETPDKPLSLTWNDDTPRVLERLNLASVTLILPEWVDVPVANLASVRHLCLAKQKMPTTFLHALATMPLQTLNLAGARFRAVNQLQDPSWEGALLQLGQMASLTNLNLSNQVLPTTLFSALARLPLTTLILEGVTLAIENREADPSYYQAILQLRHLSTLTHLNLAQLQEEDNDEGLGDIIWYYTCQQLGLPDRKDSLGTEHLQTLINNNPIHYLAHLETLNLEDAGFRGHWQFLANSAQTLKILNFCVKGASLGDAQQVPLYLLENLEELTTSSLDWFVGAEDQGVQHDNAPLLQSTSKLRVLDVKNSRIDNTHLRRLSTLQNVEELNVLSCRITSQPGADDESDLQQQGHVLLGQWPLKTLTAGFNISLHCVPVFAQPLLLTHLSLQYCGLQSLEGLNPLVNLNHLDISNNDILVSESWRHMTNLKQLRVLEFSNQTPSAVLHTDAQAHAVCMQVLAQNTHLRKLNLAGQALGLEGACALTNLHCLENLYAGSCHLGDDGFKALPLSRLKTLDVADNNLTAESAKHLCETLQQVTLPHLNVLNLATNPLGDDAMEYLASIKSLKMLNVIYVGGTTPGMQKLVPLLPQLTCLFYDGNDLSAELNATFAAVNHNG